MGRRAVTLIEVLLVILLLGMITMFVFPELGGELRRRSLTESADRLRTLIVMTHAQAMRDGLKYRLQFPGTPDPDDQYAEDEIDVPLETQQPTVQQQADPLGSPDEFRGFEAPWSKHTALQPGTRCVAVLPGRPNFEISPHSPIAGPSISEDLATFVPLTLNPDGTCDWVTLVLTDLPHDIDLEPQHVSRILNVIVDGRTGQVWVQRALRVEEVELMQERGASPILHIDFTRADLITEDNILQINMRQGGRATGGRSRSKG